MVYSTISRMEIEYLESPSYLALKNLQTNESNIPSSEFHNSTVVQIKSAQEPDEHIMQFRVKVAASLAFWCGFVQVKI